MKIRWCVAAMMAGLAAFGVRAQEGQPGQTGQTVSGFRLPEYDEQNNLKSELIGEFAKVLPDGIIDITQLKIDFYNDGKVDMTVTAPQCTYKQQEGTAVSDSAVRIARDNMVVTGEGFSWNGHDERFEIFKNAKVVLKGVRKGLDTGTGADR